jgi:PhoD-like phosphatase, N-terminal domain/PhoD-like phosphatase
MTFSRRTFAKAVGTIPLLTAARQAGAQTAGVFRHGVASGDPLASRVVIWTRLTPVSTEDPIVVEWLIAEDPELRRLQQRGVTYTNVLWDYTVKVDVARLEPGKTYYYQFRAQGSESRVGRTRTLPLGDVDRLRFAVASCSNYPYGFFNAYRQIANRLDLDFVTHLGDYIYEYANGQFGDGSATGRLVTPAKKSPPSPTIANGTRNTGATRTCRRPTANIPGSWCGTITNPPTMPGWRVRRTIPRARKAIGRRAGRWRSRHGLNGCPCARIPMPEERSTAISASAI